jgi:hypothetical protein
MSKTKDNNPPFPAKVGPKTQPPYDPSDYADMMNKHITATNQKIEDVYYSLVERIYKLEVEAGIRTNRPGPKSKKDKL